MKKIFIFFLLYCQTIYAEPLITHSYIALDKIQKVSRFRSGVGHNYSFDPAEPCRSMKHYFVPLSDDPKQMPTIMAPLDGQIVAITPEWAGSQVVLLPASYDPVRVIIFHVLPVVDLKVGQKVQSGQILGRHIGSQTYSDIAIMDEKNGKLLSYFDLMTDAVFNEFTTYTQNPITHASMIISAAERNQSPLRCGPPPEEKILSPGEIENWIYTRSGSI